MVRRPGGAEYFYGEDFDTACADGRYFKRGLDKLAGLARIIEKSGRKVVFTVAPNKSSVETSLLKGHRLPHGACARAGLRRQERLLDTYDDPHYLPLRSTLARDRRQVYWRGDTHWNYIGASVFTKALTARLDPSVSSALRFVKTTDERNGDLKLASGLAPADAREANKGLVPKTSARVVTLPGSGEFDPELPTTTDYRWRTVPNSSAVRGHTAFLGDSFTYLSLRSLTPSFAAGHFIWIGLHPEEEVVQAVMDSDTVVLEVVQRYVGRAWLLRPALRHQLRDALRAEAGRPKSR